MAALALGVVGGAIGGAVGGSALFGLMSAQALGFALGSAVGGAIDRQLFGPETVGGGRLDDLSIQVSTYGKMLPVVYAGRIAGNVIWSTDKREERSSHSSGGKGGGSRAAAESFHYSASFAVSLCEGPIAAVRRIWADSNPIWDLYLPETSVEGVTVHLGTDGQEPDALIESIEGVGNVPGYRNQAYVVFEDFSLDGYGARIPNLTFEVVGMLAAGWGEDMAQGLAQSADGDLWVVANLRRTVTSLDGRTLARKAVVGRDDGNADGYLGSLRAQPWRIAHEPVSGHLFVTCLGAARVLRIDPATDAVVAEIAVPIYPHEIAADGLGAVWVTHPWGDRLSRIDAADNGATSVALAGEPYALCRDGAGHLWISCSDAIVRFDPVAGAEVARVALGVKWFPGGLTWNPADGRIWFACSGNDVIGVLNPDNLALSWRNSGTWPAYAACHPDDDRRTVFVSLLFGNRVKLLKRGADNGLDEFAEYKTEVWPGPLLALADGRCLVSNTNRAFFQEIEGPS